MKTAAMIRATPEAVTRLVAAACDMSPISGLTHNFYRYPARFSPKLVRAVIDTFTEPGDLVLDPFVGGGTTLVESLASGRHAIGADISSLATFVSEVKTTLYSDKELANLSRWAISVQESFSIWTSIKRDTAYEEAGYTKHLDGFNTWRLKRCIEFVLDRAKRLQDERLEAFARCVTLRTAQWALNGRKKLPSIDDFRDMIVTDATNMIEGARELRVAVEAAGRKSTIRCINRTTKGLETDDLFAKQKKPRLVVTSPPYPGVHVLYHRWQVDGRKETPAPFWIANRLDGDGAAYYTMGARNTHKLNSYFANLKESLQSVAALCDRDTTIVQVVAFSEPEWQLPRYLSVGDDAGMIECFLPDCTESPDGRLWRTVPNRRWYADQRGVTNGSEEVVLFHRLKS
jgi:DNA methylase